MLNQFLFKIEVKTIIIISVDKKEFEEMDYPKLYLELPK